ncbi:MAG: hypothetical protein SGILL_002649 [Bacillariaceae sp.]
MSISSFATSATGIDATSSFSSSNSTFDDLWGMIEVARASTTVDNSTRAEFLERLDEEIDSAASRFLAEENQRQRTAKELLSSLSRENNVASLDEVYLHMEIDKIAADSVELQRSVVKTKEELEAIANCGALVFGKDCKTVFAKKMTESPWAGPNSTVVVVLSDLYQAIRSFKDSSHEGKKWEAPSSFERETTKYWVESDKLNELLHTCIQEVPLLVYGSEGRLTSDEELNLLEKDKLWNTLATEISSVYYDTYPDAKLYHDRIARKESASLFRVRWYGFTKPKGDEKLFLELKTHHEKWIDAPSVKERVNICEKHMKLFLERKPWTINDALPIVVEGNPKLKGDDLDKAVELILRMHELVVEKDLRPRVRSVYHRAALQSSTSNALRLTVDRNVTMIDETAAPPGAWCVPDDFPIDDSMRKCVPYPIFEVKLAGSNMPESINSLIANGILIEAPKFSKFLTGLAAFNSATVKTLPYWSEYHAFRDMLMPSSPKPKQSIKKVKTSSKRTKSSTATKRKISAFGAEVSVPKSQPTLRSSMSSIWNSAITSKSRNNEPNVAPKKPARRETTDGVTYLTHTGVALCIGAIVLLIHSVRVYFKRIKLMQSGNPNGYVDRFGPLLLFAVVLAGIVIILVAKSKETAIATKTTAASKNILFQEPGACYLHSNQGISKLAYQPSDVVLDETSGLLLTASLTKIVGHSTINVEEPVLQLLEIPGTDLEGLTVAEGRYFALSEPNYATDSVMLYELEWNNGDMEVVQGFSLGAAGDESAEAITYIPPSGGEEKGSLAIDRGLGDLELFVIPEENGSSSNLIRRDGFNKKMMTENLADGRIAGLFHFEGLLYVLHDNDKVLRSWDISTGAMVSEMSLPNVGGAASRQWEGFAIQRDDGNFAPLAAVAVDQSSYLRKNAQASTSSSKMIVHLALDSPPQLWSFAVEQNTSGELDFPSCAGIN